MEKECERATQRTATPGKYRILWVLVVRMCQETSAAFASSMTDNATAIISLLLKPAMPPFIEFSGATKSNNSLTCRFSTFPTQVPLLNISPLLQTGAWSLFRILALPAATSTQPSDSIPFRATWEFTKATVIRGKKRNWKERTNSFFQYEDQFFYGNSALTDIQRPKGIQIVENQSTQN